MKQAPAKRLKAKSQDQSPTGQRGRVQAQKARWITQPQQRLRMEVPREKQRVINFSKKAEEGEEQVEESGSCWRKKRLTNSGKQPDGKEPGRIRGPQGKEREDPGSQGKGDCLALAKTQDGSSVGERSV